MSRFTVIGLCVCRIYYIPPVVREILEQSFNDRLKIVNSGTRIFEAPKKARVAKGEVMNGLFFFFFFFVVLRSLFFFVLRPAFSFFSCPD